MSSQSVSDLNSIREKSNFSHLERVGDYHLLYPLGIGGMAEVYLAERLSDHNRVAIKILLPSLANNRHHLDLFIKEIKTLSVINEPRIVHPLAAGVQEDVCYFVMTYVEGRDLAAIITTETRIPELLSLQICRETAAMLKEVWEQHHIIHRDIKPENIMIGNDGEVHLLDFGLSLSEFARQSSGCHPGVGTVQYSSPEQLEGLPVDQRTDIYSLGAMLFQMLTGKLPFSGDNAADIRIKQLYEPLPDPRAGCPELSLKTVGILKKAMAKKPEERFQNWSEFIKAVDQAIVALEAQQSRIIPWEIRLKHWRLGFALCLFAIGLFTLYHFQQRPVSQPPDIPDTLIEVPQEQSEEYPPVASSIPDPSVESQDFRQQIESELNRLRNHSFQLEKEQRWTEAISFWETIQKTHEYRNESEFIAETKRQIIYLNKKLPSAKTAKKRN